MFAARNESEQRLRGAATCSRRVLNATKLPDLLPSGSRRLPSVRGANRDSKNPNLQKTTFQVSQPPQHIPVRTWKIRMHKQHKLRLVMHQIYINGDYNNTYIIDSNTGVKYHTIDKIPKPII